MRSILIGIALGIVLRIVPTVVPIPIISVITYGIFMIGVGAFVGATPLINNKKQVVLSYVGIVFGSILFDWTFYMIWGAIDSEVYRILSEVVTTQAIITYFIVLSIINSIFYTIPCYFGHFATYSKEISDKSDTSDIDDMSRIS